MNEITFPTTRSKQITRRSFQTIFHQRLIPLSVLGVIIVISIILHLYNIQSIGAGNEYYTAAVKSMLQSWHNFFFVAAEPGGSVTVDKPPLGLWFQTAFAAMFGVSGLSVTFPNLIAGVLSVPLLYYLVKKAFGVKAGLVAAFVLTITPVFLAVNRNNTMDGMLNFTLLLAAWAFLIAAESKNWLFLLAGAVLMGLGFNIKMLQAFLPLPAFFAVYLFGAQLCWIRKTFHLVLTTFILLVVSLSWAVVVDLTPANQRPYVGSSTSNSVLELALGYNGVNRLLGLMEHRPPGNAYANRSQGGIIPPSQIIKPPYAEQMHPSQAGQMHIPDYPPYGGMMPPQGAGAGNLAETGQPGILRFFLPPMAKEMSWLLPFALMAILLTAFSYPITLPLSSPQQRSLLVWGGWLFISLVFFSAAGFFHNYYLASLSTPLGALVGIGVSGFDIKKLSEKPFYAVGLWFAAGITLAFQVYLIAQLGLKGGWVGVSLALFCFSGMLFILPWLLKRYTFLITSLAQTLLLMSMFLLPSVWSVLTITHQGNNGLPSAYVGEAEERLHSLTPRLDTADSGDLSGINADLLAYLQENTQNMKYLLAVSDSRSGSNLVLKTGRPVLFMGGFSGNDKVVDENALEEMVVKGVIRFILLGGMRPGPSSNDNTIQNWTEQHCQAVQSFEHEQSPRSPMHLGRERKLYDCAP